MCKCAIYHNISKFTVAPCYIVGCIFPQIAIDNNQHVGDNKFKYKLRIHVHVVKCLFTKYIWEHATDSILK